MDFAVAVKWWEEQANLMGNPDGTCEDLRCSLKECLEFLPKKKRPGVRERLKKRKHIIEENLRGSLESKRKRDAFLEISRKNLLKFFRKEDHTRFFGNMLPGNEARGFAPCIPSIAATFVA